MIDSDKKRFFGILADVHDMYGAMCSPQAAELWFSTLKIQDIDQIEAAFKGHLRHPQFGRFAPKPADVMRELEAHSIPDFMVNAI